MFSSGRWLLLVFPPGFSWERPDVSPSKVSDQWLFVSSNLSARSLPKLVQIRLAEAAAASYALNGLTGSEVDVSFCLDARNLAANRMDVRLEAVDFATECCDLLSFDTLGSDVCFPSWPSWSVRVCCAYFAARGKRANSAQFSALWKDVTELFFDERPREPRVISYLSRGIVAYHKSGITLSSKLVGDSEAGPLSRLVLDSAGDFRVPQDLKLVDYGEHQSPRGGRPVITPYFQAFLRTFADNNGPGMFLHFSNPLKSRKPQLQDLMADDGGGLVLHLVRRPSDMIVSGYRYHGQQRREGEEWLHFSSPPDCLSCDHQAWAQIFGRCAFRCSYYQLLQNLSSVEGLQMEYLRSRWDITKMLYHAMKWKDLENVLQLPMESFQVDFNGTLRCMARFFLRAPGSPGSPGMDEAEGAEGSLAEKVQRFVEESQVDSPKFMASCREALERGETCRFPNGTAMPQKLISQVHSHISSRVGKVSLKAALKQTKGWKQFIPFADLTYEAAIDTANTRLFGCPKV